MHSWDSAMRHVHLAPEYLAWQQEQISRAIDMWLEAASDGEVPSGPISVRRVLKIYRLSIFDVGLGLVMVGEVRRAGLVERCGLLRWTLPTTGLGRPLDSDTNGHAPAPRAHTNAIPKTTPSRKAPNTHDYK